MEAAEHGEVPSLKVSFAKTHWIMMGLWDVLKFEGDPLLRLAGSAKGHRPWRP